MKWAQFKKKLNINVPAGQGDELNCKKQQHFIISIKTIKNHTILSTYQELIRRTKQKKHTYHQLYLYWATHMFWNICDDYYIQFIFLTVSKALAVFLSIIIYLHHRTILNKNNWSPITTTYIRTYYKFTQ